VVVGTTDDGVPKASIEPRALEKETEFLSEHIGIYLGRRPKESEVLSVWSGLRPLVRKQGSTNTAALSREHTVLVSASGMVSVTGGKWTTYRRMGEDAVDIAAKSAGLAESASRTQEMRLFGWSEAAAQAQDSEHELAVYGSEQGAIDELARSEAGLGELLHPALPYRYAEVVWAVRQEMARTVEDVLARRTRALFLNARAAMESAAGVAACMAQELGRDEAWRKAQVEAFTALAAGYVYRG
jgi:glycerol-3-phosphate dehydrogenase